MPWLLKTEPETYSIDDLAREGRTWWDGVRNYQARNFMRDSMRLGESVLLYHSSTEPPGVAGIARISALAKPDRTAQDPRSPYFDESASPGNPIWMMVEIEFVERFPRLIELSKLRATPGLEAMPLLRKGQRLSVQPVAEHEFEIVRRLGGESRSGRAACITEPKPTEEKAAGQDGTAKRAKPADAAAKRNPPRTRRTR